MAAKKDVQRWLDCYNPEGRVFPKLQGGVLLSASDVLLILKWKLGRIKADNAKTISETNLSQINDAIRCADSNKTTEQIRAVKMLQNVYGIGLATASAILTVCYPDKFSIIDWRVLESTDLRPKRAESWNAERYVEEFIPAIRSQQNGLTLRETDRALWGQSVARQIDNLIGKAKRL